MTSKRIQFRNPTGKLLAGRLDLPASGQPAAFGIFAHCFTCSKDLKAAAYVSRALTSTGIGMLRFDFTGLGESEGNFADTTFSSNVSDLLTAADYLSGHHGPVRLMVGHSLGGAAVLHAAGDVASCRGVATIGTPADPAHVTRHLEDNLSEIARKGEAEVVVQGRPFRFRRSFLSDLEQTDTPTAVRALARPLLILHAPLDDVVAIDHAGRIYQAARHPKSFIALDGVDHLLGDPVDARYVGGLIGAWFSRYA
jgi:fermentation-respiration switch protein FrsA (DUF1100 family)